MSKHILLVDDETTNRMVLKKYLQRLGYESVSQASGGLEALAQIVDQKPDLIFLDIMMPKVDGFMVCGMIQGVKEWESIKVIFHSTLTGKENIQKGIDTGALGYLEKPLKKEKLVEILDDIFKEEDHTPLDFDKHAVKVIMKIAEKTKNAFSMFTGVIPKFSIPQKLDTSFSYDQEWGMVGSICANGAIMVELSTGWNRELAQVIAEGMMGEKTDEDEMLIDAFKEILNISLGSALTELVEDFPAKLSLPNVTLNTKMPINHNAKHKVAIAYQSSIGSFESIITLSIPETAKSS